MRRVAVGCRLRDVDDCLPPLRQHDRTGAVKVKVKIEFVAFYDAPDEDALRSDLKHYAGYHGREILDGWTPSSVNLERWAVKVSTDTEE